MKRGLIVLALFACGRSDSVSPEKPTVIDQRLSARAQSHGRRYYPDNVRTLTRRIDAAGASCDVDTSLPGPEPLGAVSGIVTTSDGAAVPKVQVFASCPDCFPMVRDETNASGHFSLSCLPAGPYRLSVLIHFMGAELPQVAPAPVLELTGHDRHDGIHLVVDPTVTAIRGTVVSGDDGRALPGLVVRAHPSITGPPVAGATTDSAGAFVLMDLSIGSYVVRVGMSGEKAAVTGVEGGREGLVIRVPR